MEKEAIKNLLDITEEQIKYYKEYMVGDGNYDEFENALYNEYIDGYLEDSLLFCRRLLEILSHRKWYLKAKLEELENNDE